MSSAIDVVLEVLLRYQRNQRTVMRMPGIDGLSADVATEGADRKAATEIREKEAADFAAMESSSVMDMLLATEIRDRRLPILPQRNRRRSWTCS